MRFSFCPKCGENISDQAENDLQKCECGFINYENPVPVVASLVLTKPSKTLEPFGVFSLSPFISATRSAILLVKRKFPPFVGHWCLPCGFINKHEHPKAAACREVFEETGVLSRVEKILCVCNPMPGEINQMTIHYMSFANGGELKAGDDADDVKFVTQEEYDENEICFRSHRMVIEKWFSRKFGICEGRESSV